MRLFDASSLLEKGGVFVPSRDEDFFHKRLTVLNNTVAWDINGTRDPGTSVDLDPCVMYETCSTVRLVEHPDHHHPAADRGAVHRKQRRGVRCVL